MKLLILQLICFVGCTLFAPSYVSARPVSAALNAYCASSVTGTKAVLPEASAVKTPEENLKLGNKVLRSGLFSLFFILLTAIMLGLILGFPAAILFGVLPGIFCGIRALVLGARLFKRATGDDSITRKAYRRAVTGMVLGGGVVFLLLFFLVLAYMAGI